VLVETRERHLPRVREHLGPGRRLSPPARMAHDTAGSQPSALSARAASNAALPRIRSASARTAR
jgi:hypothetical protein